MEQSNQFSYTVLKRKQKRGSTPLTQKSLYESRFVQQITEFNPPPVCLMHSHEIGHICFSCDSKCLCSQCFNDGGHRAHDVKTLDRSYQIVEANLNQCLIRIKSKSDLMSLLHDSISTAQNQMQQDFDLYRDYIENSFDRVLKSLEQKKELVVQAITRFHNEQIEKTRTIMIDVRQAIKDSMTVYKLIDANIKELSNYQLCFFYADKKNGIQELISQQNIQSFKQAVPAVKWNMEPELFEQVIDKINLLGLSSKEPEEKSNKISKKKLRKISKLPNYQKHRKPRDSHPLSPQTPKQPSSKDKDRTAKQLCRRMKSPDCELLRNFKKTSGKMVSMPASPIKCKRETSPFLVIDHQRKKNKKKL